MDVLVGRLDDERQALGPGTRELISLPEGGDDEQWGSWLVGPAEKHLRPPTPPLNHRSPGGPTDKTDWRPNGESKTLILERVGTCRFVHACCRAQRFSEPLVWICEWMGSSFSVCVCVALNWVMRTTGGAKDKHAPSSRCLAGWEGGRSEEGSQPVSLSRHSPSEDALIQSASKESHKLKSIFGSRTGIISGGQKAKRSDGPHPSTVSCEAARWWGF